LVGTTSALSGLNPAGTIVSTSGFSVGSGRGINRVWAGTVGAITATTGTIDFNISTAGVPNSAFIKLSFQARTSNNTPSNHPVAEYWFQIHTQTTGGGGVMSMNGAATIFEYTFVRATHLSFSQTTGTTGVITLTNPLALTLPDGSYKLEILSPSRYVLDSVSVT
jgi:hypothetical protein